MMRFELSRKAKSLGLGAVFSLGMLALQTAPALAKPPAHAPAKGYRAKAKPVQHVVRSRYSSVQDWDRDGIPNWSDREPRRPNYYRATPGSRDFDRDGVPNWRDRDRDGDGIRNGRDRRDYRVAPGSRDFDRDGIRNRNDRDIDGDGIRNSRDRRDYRVAPGRRDMDRDGIRNRNDRDKDGDGLRNGPDRHPKNRRRG